MYVCLPKYEINFADAVVVSQEKSDDRDFDNPKAGWHVLCYSMYISQHEGMLITRRLIRPKFKSTNLCT